MWNWNRCLVLGVSVVLLTAGSAAVGSCGKDVIGRGCAATDVPPVWADDQPDQPAKTHEIRSKDTNTVPAPPAAYSGALLLGCLGLIRMKRSIKIAR